MSSFLEYFRFDNKEKTKKFFIGLYLIVIAFLFTSQGISFPASERLIYSDGSIYQYLGHLICIGKMPYKDAFDHKGPLLYLINALSCKIGIYNGGWIIDLIFMIAAVSFMYKSVRKVTGTLFSMVLILIVITDFSHSYWEGNTPDFYALPLNAMVLFLLLDYYIDGSLSRLKAFLVGVLTACVFWLKLTSIIGIATMCFLIVIDCLLKKNYKAIIRYLVWFIIGFWGISSLLFIWLIVKGAFDSMINDYFAFNLFYAESEGSLYTRALAFWTFITRPTSLFCIVMTLMYGALMLDNKQEDKASESVLLIHLFIAFMMTLLVVSLPGRQYLHYLSFVPPYILLITAVAAQKLQDNHNQVKYSIEIVVCTLALVFIVYPGIQTIRSNSEINWTKKWEDEWVLNNIETVCSNDDRIAVMTPDECGYYLFSGFESATTYPYIQATRYDDREFKIDYISQLDKNSAKALIWKKNRNIGDFFQDMPEVLQKYELCAEIDSFQIYVLK